MSDLSIYELEDNVWDEFSDNNHHIVPHPVEECGDQSVVHGDTNKKPKCEIVEISSGDASKYVQNKEEASLLTLAKEDRTLGKGSWSHAPDGVFPIPCGSGSVKEVASIASEATRTSNHSSKSGNTDSVGGDFAGADTILSEKSATDNNGTYPIPPSQVSQTDNDLNFFGNREDKENDELLYYGWPDDIGNFEDVDRMFRSCDSTFGLGSLSNEDDLCWFSSSYSNEGSEDALKLSKFSSSETNALNSISDHHEASRLNSAGPLVNDSNKKSSLMDDKLSSNNADAGHSGFDHFHFSNGSDAGSVNKNSLMLKKQISPQKNQAKGKRKGQHLDKGGSSHRSGNFKQVLDAKCSQENASQHVFCPPGSQQPKPDIGLDSLNYVQTNIPCLHTDFENPSDQTSVCPSPWKIKSERNVFPSPSLKESTFASDQVQTMKNSHGPSLESSTIINENGERLYHCQNLQAQYARTFKCANIASPTVFCESVQNQTCQSDLEVEDHSASEGICNGNPAELDSNVQESSCMSSALDEISLEASSFCQLQQVMEQLDVRTKLCIRDSLYRLARSAEQRHNCVNTNGGEQDDRDTSTGLSTAEHRNRGTGFLDMETDTNPIDRSIAHLLFHRP